MKQTVYQPLVLVILDGWGIAPRSASNAITAAKTPVFKRLWSRFAHAELRASGIAVGLPAGQDGNSEAGHMNIGAGRIVEQDAVLISRTIKDGTFFKNPALLSAVHIAEKRGTHIHVMGLLSNHQSAHSSPEHLYALLDFLHVNYGKPVYLHLFTDGRDSSRYGSVKFMQKLLTHLHETDIISTVSGRYYAMDRVKNWDRTRRAYNAMVLAEGIAADNPMKACTEAYNRGETDEFIAPTIIVNPKRKSRFIADGDVVINFNLRSDRARQITKPFVQDHFERAGFKRKKKLKDIHFVAFTDFGADLDSVQTAFPPQVHRNTLPFVLDGLRQLYVAEREKFAHVTYFFGGGIVCNAPTVRTVVVPSARVSTFDQRPRMSLAGIEKVVVQSLKKATSDVIVVNVANPDMVAHTGNLKATIRAIEYTDAFIGAVWKAVKEAKGTLLITADHGNAEELTNLQTTEVDTEHSGNPVPFIMADARKGTKKVKMRTTGKLADVAPTVLQILGIKKPSEMTGTSLI